VLGGYGQVHERDIETSKRIIEMYIEHIKRGKEGRRNNLMLLGSKLVALDCGAGIGRVAKFLLMPIVS